MKLGRAVATVCAAALISGCAPSVLVENNTTFGVRVIVSQLFGTRSVVSPTPGSSSSVEVEDGPYAAVALIDTEWVAEARRVQRVLSDRLGAHLTGDRRLERQDLDGLLRRVDELSAALVALEQAAPSAAKCSGHVSQDAGGVVSIAQAPDGQLSATCH